MSEKDKTFKPVFAERPTTGDKELDRAINNAVDTALLKLQPIIRDAIRAELKRHIEAEPIIEPTKGPND